MSSPEMRRTSRVRCDADVKPLGIATVVTRILDSPHQAVYTSDIREFAFGILRFVGRVVDARVSEAR